MCQICYVDDCNRDRYSQIKSTAKSRYRKFEQLLTKKTPKTLNAVILMMQGEGFNITRLSGEGKCSDKQLTKKFGKGRYHMRVYDYPRRIVIESHIDAVDPWRDLVGHVVEHLGHRVGLMKESSHNIVVIRK